MTVFVIAGKAASFTSTRTIPALSKDRALEEPWVSSETVQLKVYGMVGMNHHTPGCILDSVLCVGCGPGEGLLVCGPSENLRIGTSWTHVFDNKMAQSGVAPFDTIHD
jgi:hypothetical protein